MRNLIVAVFDKAVGAYMRPMFVPSSGAALRSFSDEVNRQGEDNPMYKHPGDYEMFALGFFDDLSGEFETHKPDFLSSGALVSER